MEELSILIEETRRGKLDAYDRLVRRFQDMAVGYAYSQLGDFHLAEDAAQEAFVLAYLELGKLREPEAFPGWFRRIVHSRCTRLRRSQKLTTVELDAASHVATAEQNPDQALDTRQTRDALLAALDALSERDRSIASLFYIGQFSQSEIAAFMDVPASTVNNRLHLSRKRLKKELVNMDNERVNSHHPSRDEAFATRINERLQTMENLHRDLATGLADIISATLQQKTKVEVAAAQTTFEDFIQSLPSPSLTLHHLMEPNAGRIIFDLSPELAHAVEAELVGTGTAAWKDAHNTMSEQQWAKLAPFGKAIEACLTEIWQPVFAISLQDAIWESNIVGFLANPAFETLPTSEKLAALHEAPADSVVRVDFTVASSELDCRLSLCYPAATLETLLPHLA